MKKQIAIIQLKEKTTLLEQLKQNKVEMQSKLEQLTEQVLLAELVEKENCELRQENSELKRKLSTIKTLL